MADSKDGLDVGLFEWPLPNTEHIESYRFLNKRGVAWLWDKIKSKFIAKPDGGEAGQVLTKTDGGYVWKDAQAPLPDILPIEKGGTGVSSIEELRAVLFDFPTNEELFSSLGLE